MEVSRLELLKGKVELGMEALGRTKVKGSKRGTVVADATASSGANSRVSMMFCAVLWVGYPGSGLEVQKLIKQRMVRRGGAVREVAYVAAA